jgi:DNA excision repair protein ERCC-5
MRAEDFDTSSPDFQLLPREVQYDIISDARIRSRAPNWNRLQSMLRAAPTALDFSKAQIESLQKRNTLTHQMWGLAGIEQMTAKMTSQIGRIASERGKQYVLMKNEGKEGGWVLGVQDEGTAEKPIVVDPEDDEEQERKAFVKEAERRQRQLRDGILTSGKFITVEDEEEAAEMERR